MTQIIIDATDLLVGRLATYAAKQVLLGNEVIVLNSEKAVVGGKKEKVFEEYIRRMHRGIPRKGPFLHRMPDRLLRRTIRGMLPFKKSRGREAYKRVMCYIGVPEQFNGKKPLTLEHANKAKLPSLNYVDLYTLSKRLGAKV